MTSHLATLRRSVPALPSNNMSLESFDLLYRLADSAASLIPVAVAGGADRTVLEALRTAFDRGWIEPRVAGPEEEIRRVASASGVSLDGFTLLDSADPA